MVQLNLSGLVNDACDEDFDPILTPAQTYQKLLRNETEKIRFSEMAGRIAAVMLVPYPPGIPMSMPGERLGGSESPVIKLILAMEEFGKRFPGFEREVHGIEADARGQTTGCAPSSRPPAKRKMATANSVPPTPPPGQKTQAHPASRHHPRSPPNRPILTTLDLLRQSKRLRDVRVAPAFLFLSICFRSLLWLCPLH